MTNDKIFLLLSFSMGLFINMGTLYIITILGVSNFEKLRKESIVEKYMDYILSFMVGILIQQIYIPFFLLSIFIGYLMSNEINNIDFNSLKEKITVIGKKILSANSK